MATSAPVGWWGWIAEAMPHNVEAGGGLMMAVIQLAIALGSTVGGLVPPSQPVRRAPVMGQMLALQDCFA